MEGGEGMFVGNGKNSTNSDSKALGIFMILYYILFFIITIILHLMDGERDIQERKKELFMGNRPII